MSFMKILMLLAIIGAGFHFKNKYEAKSAMETAVVSPNGFIELPPGEGMDNDTVIVVAAENCPKEDSQRAESLADELRRHNIPITRTHTFNFQFNENPGPAIMGRINTVMKGELPVVFINGKAKNNPTLDEVLSEFAGPGQ